MVSLLVETGFISNPDEEEKLTDKQHQHDLPRQFSKASCATTNAIPHPVAICMAS
jgi:hypothetical protein